MKQRSILPILVAGLVLVTGLVAQPGSASAHVLRQNNGISGVLHIPPNDDPTAGVPTKLGVSFANKTRNFSLQDCNCTVALQLDGKTVQTATPTPALAGATLDSFSTVTFPQVGVYTVHVTGSSKTNVFPDFTLDYPVRVATDARGGMANVTKTSNGSMTPIIIGLGSFALIAIVAYAAIGEGGRYAPAPEPVKSRPPRTKSK